MRLIGTVVKVVGGKSHVVCDGLSYTCDLRARLFRRKNLRLAVGDRVEFEPNEREDAPEAAPQDDPASSDDGPPPEEAPYEGMIEGVEKRRNALRRVRDFKRDQVLCANVDRVFLVAAVLDPPYKRAFLDRVIVACERDGIEPFLVFNKLDLADPSYAEFVAADARVYTELGYEAMLVSASADFEMQELASAFAGRISAVVGPSGVGKSTILNALSPGLKLRTGEVSQADGRGKHTTTAAELVPLPILPGREQGFVVDTPGLRGFGLWDLRPQDIAHGYREIAEQAGGCRFRNCMHKTEPKCAVRDAVEEGTIDEERFDSYSRLVAELEAAPERRQENRRR